MSPSSSARGDDAGAREARPVCILGMHRTGTSATARLVNLLGVDLGPEQDMLAPVPSDNPTGFWEQREIMALNDELLERLGGRWWRPPGLPPGWADSPDIEDLRAKAARVVDERFAARGPWGFKDPRASLTLPFWRRILPQLRFVVCVRHPAAVAASLVRRDPELHPWAASVDLWLTYTALAVAQTAGEDSILVLYEDLIVDLDGQLDRLARFLHGRPEVPPTARAEAHRFLDPSLSHHASPPAGSEDVVAEARVLFDVLRREVPRPRDAGASATPEEALAAVARGLLDAHRGRIEAERAIAAASKRIEQLEAGGEAEKRARRARDELRSARARLDREARRSERRKQDLRAMESSLSWRLTRPLRAAGRIARRRRGASGGR